VLLMAALFESFLYPFVIMFSVPLAAVGGFLGLYLVNQFLSPQPLDILTMLGFVILIGVVVNNAILVVHQALNFMRQDNLPPREAIRESVHTRVRPIMMSTVTSVCGMLPLVFFPGAGSELYRGLGSVVVGGLTVSTVFTLFVVPTLFSLVLDARSKFQFTRQRPIQPEPQEIGVD
jgi:HAE1 family hydrophobic/amphiphilic exporter-1